MRTAVVLLSSVFLLLACGDDDRVVDDAPGMGDAGSDTDGGVTPTPDAGPADDGGTTPDAGPVADDAGSEATGGLAGDVTRSAMPRAGGVGDLYIAVFDRDPVLNRDSAVVIGRVIVEDADMAASDASIPYAVDGIPPRAEPYFVSAFLDDNMNAGTDPGTAGPDRGDLVSLMGLGSPSVTVSSPSTVAFDVVLNTNLPF